MKKIIYIVLIIIWMTLIFFLSNDPSEQSTKLSDGFISKTIVNVYKIFNKNITEQRINEIKKTHTKPIRKLAHFTIYLILGILVTLLLKEYNITNKNIILLSILICLLYATSDEVHQIFVSGRSGEIKDVLIDTSGSILGILLIKNTIIKNRNS